MITRASQIEAQGHILWHRFGTVPIVPALFMYLDKHFFVHVSILAKYMISQLTQNNDTEPTGHQKISFLPILKPPKSCEENSTALPVQTP